MWIYWIFWSTVFVLLLSFCILLLDLKTIISFTTSAFTDFMWISTFISTVKNVNATIINSILLMRVTKLARKIPIGNKSMILYLYLSSDKWLRLICNKLINLMCNYLVFLHCPVQRIPLMNCVFWHFVSYFPDPWTGDLWNRNQKAENKKYTSNLLILYKYITKEELYLI